MARKYEADSIVSIKNDRDRVRKRPSMFIPSTHKDGAVHIIFEIIDNSIDELSIEGSVGNTLTVTFDTKTREITIIDDGRGIPHDALLDAYTVLNTSGKFDNDENTAYTYSGGSFGVGAKCAVFLSKACEVTSIRGGKYLTYQFKDGLLIGEDKGKSKEHGTITKFTIDSKIIEMDDVTVDDIKDRLHEKSYCFPDINMTLIILEGGKEVKSITYAGNTLLDLVKKWKPDTDIVQVEDVRKVNVLRNIDDDDISTVKVIVSAALSYKEEALDADTDAFIVSYANSIKTYDGGQHVEGLKQGLIKFVKEFIVPKLTKKDKDLQVTPTDITSGLCGMVSVKLARPEFSAQHKSRLSNQEVKFAVRDAVYEALCKEKQSVVNAMGDFIKRVAKGRMASKKVRKKDVDNAFSDDRPDKFRPIIYNLKTVAPELILVEGDSGAGLASSARDPNNQAIYAVRKPKNIFDVDSDHVMHRAKSVFNDIMDICGIEPGKKCDPSKSVMRYIVMLTDGDIDGDQIAITVICLLAKHCRPMIDAGMVGRILPPLYSFGTKKGTKKFVRSKREFFDHIAHRFIEEVTVKLNGKPYSKKQLAELLDMNFSYDLRLNKLAKRYCCDPKLLEYIAWKYHGNAKDQKKSYWMQALRPYPDLRILIEDKQLVIDGEIPGVDYVNLAFDDHFDTRINKFKEVQANNASIYGYSIGDKDGMSLYDVMDAFRRYIPKDVKYYKGLGELTVKEMRELCMDREKRTMVIFKFKDFEEDMKKINVIMSTKAEAAETRSKILYSLTLDDMDLVT